MPPAAVIPVVPSADWLLPEPVVAPALAPPAPDNLRLFVHVLALLICVFLLVRSIGCEPFGVPTGSMAPTLYGHHREAACPRCGYPIRVGEPPDFDETQAHGRTVAGWGKSRCPNCDFAVDLTTAPPVSGDRLFVDKTAFLARPPRRWEIAVFQCPADLKKPYVKRIVGLPGERIRIVDGDVTADGVLVRKTLGQYREVRQTIFDITFAPPGGWAGRWLVEPVVDSARLPTLAPRPPAGLVGPDILRGADIHFSATSPSAVGLTYRHWNLDEQLEEPITDAFSYNGGPTDRRAGFGKSRPDVGDLVHDFGVEFDLDVIGGAGTFALRLGDGLDTVRADLPIATAGPLLITHDGGGKPSTATAESLAVGATYHVEFAFVDRRASLAINGIETVAPLELPDLPVAMRRGGMARPLQLGARGVSVVVRNFRLTRDIHYQAQGVAKAGWTLGPDEYFLLGDNTANSHDSRFWTDPKLPQGTGRPIPGVPTGDFLGKPFVVHQPLRLGRVTVNGRDRAFQTLDWSRLRLLR